MAGLLGLVGPYLSSTGELDFNSMSDTDIDGLLDYLSANGNQTIMGQWENSNLTDTTQGLALFGQNGILGTNLMDTLGTLGGIGSGIASYFNGQKMLGLAKDQFEFQKGLANRNLANQAKIINNQYDSSAQVAAAMAGRNGQTTNEKIKRYEDNARNKHVDSSWVG